MSAIDSPATDFTLLDLYRAIDWSGVSQSLEKWAETNPSENFEGEEVFRSKFRMVLLDEALHSTEPSRQKDAQTWLERAGVWGQVLDFYRDHGLMENG